jgi:Uma2 family endonuclease
MDGSTSSLPPDVKRHKFTSADVQAMIEAGIIRDGEHHIELIGGELIEMAPQGPLHWRHTQRLVEWFWRNLPQTLTVASMGPLRLSDEDEPEPEAFVFPVGMDVNDVRGANAALVVEVSLTSRRIDLTVKAPLYARHGVGVYWVIDFARRQTLVHTLGPDGAYGDPAEVSFDAQLAAPAGLSLRVADIVPA